MLTGIQRYVVTLSVQALLYGIYLGTLIQCLRWLIFTDEDWKPRENINSLTLALATVFIFLTSTTNLITTLQFMLAILKRDDYSHIDGTIGIAMSVSEFLALLSIDYALIYRCWIVYGKSWRVICVPVTFWLGLLACSTLSSYYGTLITGFKLQEMALTGLAICNIATTVYTTTAIIVRIWHTTKRISGGSPKRLNYTMRVLAESGILYTCTIIFRLAGAVLVTQDDDNRVNIFINDISDVINFSMAGISFNLLLMRVYQSRVQLQDSMAESRNVDGMRTLSEMQFNNPQITASPEGPPSNTQGKAIKEYRRSNDGLHGLNLVSERMK